MNINVTEIVNNKIAQLQESKAIEKAIEDTFEKSILKAVSDALDSYSLKRDIEEKMSKQVSTVVADLDFSSYNGFIVSKMKQITEDICREDLCKKIEATFTNMFICKKENIKLSEIFEKYREIVCEDVVDSDKYERQKFHIKCHTDEKYGWIDCELDEDPDKGRYSDMDIKFTVHRKKDNIGWISSVYLDGKGIDKQIKFGHLNDVEIMLIQAVYNQIPIIIDVDDEYDLDNSYDVDY